MANLPESFFVDPIMGGAFASFRGIDWPSATAADLIHLLHDPQCREQALSFLNKKRETGEELALLFWRSFNTVNLLLQELTSIYRVLSPEKLTTRDSTRVCDSLALLQCLASHRETKKAFLNALVPEYVYPLLQTTENGRPFQILRVASLRVLAALVENDEDPILPQAVHYFIETELLFMCLRCLELGDVLTQTAATFIVLKILMQEEGLRYCCGYSERFFAVAYVFSGMVDRMDDEPSPELLKNLIPCYLRMSAAPRACDALSRHLPSKLWNTLFISALRDDSVTTQKLHQLFYNVTAGHWANPEPVWDVLQAPAPLTIR